MGEEARYICSLGIGSVQAIKLTEELLQGDDDVYEEAGPSASSATMAQPAKRAPNVVLTEAPAIQLSSVLPATVPTGHLSRPGVHD